MATILNGIQALYKIGDYSIMNRFHWHWVVHQINEEKQTLNEKVVTVNLQDPT